MKIIKNIIIVFAVLFLGLMLLRSCSRYAADELIAARERVFEEQGKGFKRVYGEPILHKNAETVEEAKANLKRALEDGNMSDGIKTIRLNTGETVVGRIQYSAHDYYSVVLNDGTRVKVHKSVITQIT